MDIWSLVGRCAWVLSFRYILPKPFISNLYHPSLARRYGSSLFFSMSSNHGQKHGIKDNKGSKEKKEKKARKERSLHARPSKQESSSNDEAADVDDKRLLESCKRNTTPGASSAAVAVPLPVDSSSLFPVSSEFSFDSHFKKIEDLLEANKKDVLTCTTEALGSFNEQCIKPQFLQVHKSIDAVSARQDSADEKFEDLQKQMRELQLRTSETSKQMGILEQPSLTRTDRDSDQYDRLPALGILLVNTDKGVFVTKTSVIEAISPWLTSHDLAPDKWLLDGKTIDNRFTIIPQMAEGPASRKLRNAHAALRLKVTGDGPRWKALYAKSVDEEPIDVKLFHNFDESPKERRENGGARALLRLCKELYPSKDIRKNRLAITTEIEGKQQPILRISAATPGDPTTIGIIDKFFDKSGFDATVIKTRFEAGGPQLVDEAEWRDL